MFELLGGGDGLRERAALAPQRGKDGRLHVGVESGCEDVRAPRA
jgi:hypothetical protein